MKTKEKRTRGTIKPAAVAKTYYLTRWALTRGIAEVSVAPDQESRANGEAYVYAFGFHHRIGRGAFESKETAEDAARSLASRRLRCLEGEVEAVRELIRKPKWWKT